MTRGELVIVDFRPVNPRAGVRPALVVQNDRDNARMGNTIVAQVTTNISRSHLDTQLLIEPQHPDWLRSGLRHPSAINGSNVYTIEQADVARIIGSLSDATMQQVNECLKTALGLSNA
ncbi:MAG: type II toxin-antitoxin system PemK/MazF family toxin [Planctomycetaceae bacterium]|nr:type II toxin-antitoxin system PemK/MazF family toxin [Planctomycetaceae bacterium]